MKSRRVKKHQRIVYRLTDRGRSALHTWLRKEVVYLPYRDPFLLWASNVNHLSPEEARDNIERHISLNRDRLEFFENIVAEIESESHELILQRKKDLSQKDYDRLRKTKAFIFKELALQAENQIQLGERLLSFSEKTLDH